VQSRDEGPEGGLRTKSPEAEAVCRHCLQVLTEESRMGQNWIISLKSPPDSRPVGPMFDGGGLSDIVGAQPPARAWRHHVPA